MAELKQSRWVRVHEPGQANFIENKNVMDILIGAERCQAEVTYSETVRSFKKAAYWLLRYLENAGASPSIGEDILSQIAEAADNAKREDEETIVAGGNWNCSIERMGDGGFRVHLDWSVEEPVTKKAKALAPKPAPKKRGRKKKEARK